MREEEEEAAAEEEAKAAAAIEQEEEQLLAAQLNRSPAPASAEPQSLKELLSTLGLGPSLLLCDLDPPVFPMLCQVHRGFASFVLLRASILYRLSRMCLQI